MSKTPKCSNPIGAQGSANGLIQLYIPFKVTSGNHSIQDAWGFTWTATSNLTLGTCKTNFSSAYSACYRAAYNDLNSFSYIIDKTNGTYYYPTNYWSGVHNGGYNQTYCYSGSCHALMVGKIGSTSGSTTFTWWWNVTAMIGWHHYYVFQWLDSVTDSGCSESYAVLSGCAGDTTLNMATLGNGAGLMSLTVK